MTPQQKTRAGMVGFGAGDAPMSQSNGVHRRTCLHHVRFADSFGKANDLGNDSDLKPVLVCDQIDHEGFFQMSAW